MKNTEQEEVIIKVEQLNLVQLEERIQKLRDMGHTYDQIFLQVSNGWQYGTLKLPQVRTLAHLRNIIHTALLRQAA